MINFEKEVTNDGLIIKITKDNKTLFLSRPYNNDLFISLFDEKYPGVFNIDITDDNLYMIIDKLYSNISKINNEGNNNLFYNNIIDYRSDDSSFELASRLIITKQNHNYSLVILENRDEKSGNTVCISNKNSRYKEDNAAFFEMYNDLNTYDFKSRKLYK